MRIIRYSPTAFCGCLIILFIILVGLIFKSMSTSTTPYGCTSLPSTTDTALFGGKRVS